MCVILMASHYAPGARRAQEVIARPGTIGYSAGMAATTTRLELRLYPSDEEALSRLIALSPPGATRTSAIRTAVAEALARRERPAVAEPRAQTAKKLRRGDNRQGKEKKTCPGRTMV